MSLSDLYDEGRIDERIQELIESDKFDDDLLWDALGPNAFDPKKPDVERAVTDHIKNAIRERDEAELGRLLMKLAIPYIENCFVDQAEQDCIDEQIDRAEALAERYI